VENKSEINSGYPLEFHMMNLELDLQNRFIVWNTTTPTSEHLQCYFDKFDLLRLAVEQLTSDKFDIIQKSESTYERFLYVHFPEEESIITIFVKINFKIDKNKKNFQGQYHANSDDILLVRSTTLN
jgi:hypothetical protein